MIHVIGTKHCPRLSEDDLPGMLRAMTGEQHNPVLGMNVKRFRDPSARTRHIGTHPIVLRSVMRHPTFGAWLDQLTLELERLVHGAPTRRIQDIIIACNKGKHRSVACGLFVAACLCMREQRVAATYHHRAHWMLGCGGCHECLGPSEERTGILLQFSALYKQRFRALRDQPFQ
ncbi:MAG: hypothetical protein L6R35_007242 [Caloplaca aegaea]|nr:MAG: hypothetical protein L6R35_007242 [Caloplaca aegaea]